MVLPGEMFGANRGPRPSMDGLSLSSDHSERPLSIRGDGSHTQRTSMTDRSVIALRRKPHAFPHPSFVTEWPRPAHDVYSWFSPPAERCPEFPLVLCAQLKAWFRFWVGIEAPEASAAPSTNVPALRHIQGLLKVLRSFLKDQHRDCFLCARLDFPADILEVDYIFRGRPGLTLPH